MGEVPEAEGGPSEVLEAADQGSCRRRHFSASVGPFELPVVEPGEDVVAAGVEGAAELGEFFQGCQDGGLDAVDHGGEGLVPECPVGVAVGVDDVLGDPLGVLDAKVLVVGEEGVEAGLLPVGEERGAGAQGAAGPVERVVPTASAAGQLALNALAGGVQFVAGQGDHVERGPSPSGLEGWPRRRRS